MTNALVGKATVSITCIAPTENAAETMREFFKDHMEFMKAKSHQEGPLKLLMYSISESPEQKENTSWTEGKYPEKTGRTVFNLYEIYDNEEGLHHHWIESAEYLPVFTQLAEVHQIEWLIFNQMKVTQSLWDQLDPIILRLTYLGSAKQIPPASYSPHQLITNPLVSRFNLPSITSIVLGTICYKNNIYNTINLVTIGVCFEC